MSGFFSKFIEYSAEDGAYSLTGDGITAVMFLLFVAIILVAVGVFAAFNSKKNKGKDNTVFTTKQLVFSAVALALAFPLSYIKILPMPWGGAITLCSMFFVTLTGYWYGPVAGFAAAIAYSLLQFMQDGSTYMLSLFQVLFDYLLAFTALGASGFFKGKKNGMITGYLVAIILRGLFHSIGGYLYWMDYMPDTFPKSLAFIYPIVYNYSYILGEGLITVIILLLPPVKKALARIEKEN